MNEFQANAYREYTRDLDKSLNDIQRELIMSVSIHLMVAGIRYNKEDLIKAFETMTNTIKFQIGLTK